MSSADEDMASDIEESASSVFSGLIKSREKYQMAYSRYERWCNEKEVKDITNEKALLGYFGELSKVQKPSSLWCYYSMLRTELLIKKNVNIKEYTNLIALLKSKSVGYKPKKSKVFSKENIVTFLQNADDERFLWMKVVLIFGLAGACKREELAYLLKENVIDEGVCFRVLIPNKYARISREFFITSGNIDGLNLVEIVRQYLILRPEYCENNRFFLSFKNGRCKKQPIGINTIGNVPSLIAQFLKLPHPKQYTGHCLWKTPKTFSAHSGVNFLTVKTEKRNWITNCIVEEDPLKNDERTAMEMLREQQYIPSTSDTMPTMSFEIQGKVALISGGASGIGLQYARELLRNGLRGVTLADVDSEYGAKALQEIETEFGLNKAVFIQTDVTNMQNYEVAFKKTIQVFKNLDILINIIEVLNDAIWEKEIAINVNGVIHGVLLGLENYIPEYRTGSEGVIVNISSISGIKDVSILPIYTGTKFAVAGMSKSWGDENHYNRTNVKVLALCAGSPDIPLTSDMSGRSLEEPYQDMFEEKVDIFNSQRSESGAHVLVEIIRNAQSGAIWVAENGAEPYEYVFAPRMNFAPR